MPLGARCEGEPRLLASPPRDGPNALSSTSPVQPHLTPRRRDQAERRQGPLRRVRRARPRHDGRASLEEVERPSPPFPSLSPDGLAPAEQPLDAVQSELDSVQPSASSSLERRVAFLRSLVSLRLELRARSPSLVEPSSQLARSARARPGRACDAVEVARGGARPAGLLAFGHAALVVLRRTRSKCAFQRCCRACPCDHRRLCLCARSDPAFLDSDALGSLDRLELIRTAMTTSVRVVHVGRMTCSCAARASARAESRVPRRARTLSRPARLALAPLFRPYTTGASSQIQASMLGSVRQLACRRASSPSRRTSLEKVDLASACNPD